MSSMKIIFNQRLIYLGDEWVKENPKVNDFRVISLQSESIQL